MSASDGFPQDTDERTRVLLREIAETLPLDLPDVSSDGQTQALQFAEHIARYVGILEPLASDMATVTKTIGTTGRDYSTIASWEADLDNGAVYSSGDDAVGECYDDSTFTESVTINGGGTVGLNSITLRAASGERHDGTAGNGGVTNQDNPGNLNPMLDVASGIVQTDIDWIIWLPESGTSQNARHGVKQSSDNLGRVRNNIVDGAGYTAGTSGHTGVWLFRDDGHSLNNIILNVLGNGVHLDAPSENSFVRNTTVYNCTEGINVDEVVSTLNNNISVGNGTDYTGSPNTATHNLDEDSTAPGTSTQTDTPADLFVSTTGGSEDLHIDSANDAIDNGTDLGTTNGVEIDINGRDRDSNGDTWDIGAHEFVAAGGGFVPYPNPRYSLGGGHQPLSGGVS